MSGGVLIFLILMFYHVSFAVKIKLLVSRWNAMLWNELSSSSSSLQCKDKQLRYSKILHQLCDIRGDYFEQSISAPLETFESHALIKTTRNWVRPIKPSTIKKHVFPQSKTVSVASWKNVSAMCFHTTLLVS